MSPLLFDSPQRAAEEAINSPICLDLKGFLRMDVTRDDPRPASCQQTLPTALFGEAISGGGEFLLLQELSDRFDFAILLLLFFFYTALSNLKASKTDRRTGTYFLLAAGAELVSADSWKGE